MLNSLLLDVSGSDNAFLLNLNDVQFRLFEDDCLPRQFNDLFLFLNIWDLNLPNLNLLLFNFNDLFSFHSLDIDLHNWLLIEHRLLADDLDRTLNLYGDLYSLLHRDNILNVDHSINQPVDVDFDWVFFNDFN